MIHLPLNQSPRTGKGFFLNKLAEAMVRLGAEVTSDVDAHHSAAVNVGRVNTKSACVVFRIDSIPRSRIGQMRSDAARSDKIIFQSEFTAKLYRRTIGKIPCSHRVIHNGSNIVDTMWVGRRNFMAVSRSWRACKRLSDTIESFLLAFVPDSLLYVVGNVGAATRRKYSNRSVKFVGLIGNDEFADYYPTMCAMIHLCWLDSCPNAVVEAIAAGVPVITNNVGGTRELVGPAGGIICDVDRPYDYKADPVGRPPKINRRVVAEAIERCAKSHLTVVRRDHVDIDNVARQYLEFIGG